MNANAKNQEEQCHQAPCKSCRSNLKGRNCIHAENAGVCVPTPLTQAIPYFKHTTDQTSSNLGVGNLYIVILIDEVDITDATAVGGNELLVTGGSLIAIVGGKHALKAHADALNCLHWGPAGGAQEIKADNAIAVDMGMHWDCAGCASGVRTLDELDLWGF
jgi:hypothetical protein